MSSENQLIRQAQAGETEAFCLLARAHERRIFSLAFHYCRDHQDAEDLSQEVWLKAYSALSSFRFESTFYTWLRKITINCFLNHRRRNSRTVAQPEQLTDQNGIDAVAAESNARHAVNFLEVNLQNRLVVEKVMQALADVTPQQRLVFLLKHEEGMTYEEISNALGCSIGTVKKSVSRTVTRLRETLGATDDNEDYISCAATGLLS